MSATQVYVSILTRPMGRVLRAQRVGGAPKLRFVSILTRPMGRVLRALPCPYFIVQILFQSSPDLWAGCYSGLTVLDFPAETVSILTRPMGRVLREYPRYSSSYQPVSILTRPMGRVLRAMH